MTDSIKNALSGVKNGWSKIDTKRRKLLIGALLAMTMTGIALGISGSNVDYALLFSNMELSDAGAIVGDLEAKKIKYTLEDGGKTILIEESQVDSYRMELAVNNMLPESSTGFEIFDDTGLMVTDEDRQIMYQRALTGEIQRTISSLDGIISAKVHLVMPQKSIFETEAKNASASVVIDTSPGFKVSEDNIRGIAALISGAVDNMPVDNIQIIDSNGSLLSSFLSQENGYNLSSTLDQYSSARSSFQKEIENKLLSLLGGVYGFDKIKVSVLAELDFNSEESTVITYSDPLIRSEQVSAAGSGMNQQEVTGGTIDDNITNVFEGEEDKDVSYSHTVNNELSSETRNIIKAPGQVKKMTTSIVYAGDLSEEDRGNIQSIVAAAIGYDGDRGDLVSVVGVSPAASDSIIDEDLDTNPEAPEGFFAENKMILLIGGAILGFIILLIVVILIMKSKKRKKEDLEYQQALEKGVNIEEAFGGVEDIVMKKDENSEKAQKYANEHPDLVADLIKSWTRE